MTDKMPREEIIRRLRVLAALEPGDLPPENEGWLVTNGWARGIQEAAVATVDLIEGPGPKTRREALESLPRLRWYAEDSPGQGSYGYAGWLVDSLEALGVLKWRQ